MQLNMQQNEQKELLRFSRWVQPKRAASNAACRLGPKTWVRK
jgi:hypothetical protein